MSYFLDQKFRVERLTLEVARTLDSSSNLFKKLYFSYKYLPIHCAYYESYFDEIDDLSIIVKRDQTPVAGAFIRPVDGRISYFGMPIEIALIEGLDANEQELVYREITHYLGQYFSSGTYSEIVWKADPFLDQLLSGKIDETQLSFVGTIPLDLCESAIYRNFRKRYKSMINWGKKNLQVDIFDAARFSEEAFYETKNFHHQVSGRKTRSDKTWELQAQAVLNDRAFLVTGRLNGALVSSILVLSGLQEAYYGVAVNDRQLFDENKPIGHWPLYRAILEAKSRGLSLFTLGAVEGSFAGDKDRSIAQFKKGFAVNIVPELSRVGKFSISKLK